MKGISEITLLLAAAVVLASPDHETFLLRRETPPIAPILEPGAPPQSGRVVTLAVDSVNVLLGTWREIEVKRRPGGIRWKASVGRRKQLKLQVNGELRPVRSGSFRINPGLDALACVAGHCWRGVIDLQVVGDQVRLVNRLPLEEYLRGVVPAEIGRRRDPTLKVAVEAQAVVARTYAVRRVLARTRQPWHLHRDVTDQVYEGVDGEDLLADRAVLNTRGLMVCGPDGPVETYYHSTAAGHTADIRVVWPERRDAPWLRGAADTTPDGTSWSAASPHMQWTDVLDRQDALRRAAQWFRDRGRSVRPRGFATAPPGPDGRIPHLLVLLEKGDTALIPGDASRWILRRPGRGSPILRSSRYRLQDSAGLLVAHGSGMGHGVGLCQFGAMGRAAAGQDLSTILTAYYPGTFLCHLEASPSGGLP